MRRGYLKKWTRRSPTEPWNRWDISEEALDFVRPRKGPALEVGPHGRKKIKISHDEIIRLAMTTDMTLLDIAKIAGVSRERIRQILKRRLGINSPGWAKRKEITARLRAERAAMPRIRQAKLDLINRVVAQVGYKVRTIPQSPHVYINDRLCGLRVCKVASHVGERGTRKYYKIRITYRQLMAVEFLVVLVGGDAEKAFVMPSEVLLDSLGPSLDKIFYFPSERLPVYNNQYSHINYHHYEEAWSQLEEKPKVDLGLTSDLNSGDMAKVKAALEFFTDANDNDTNFWHYKDSLRRYWDIQASKGVPHPDGWIPWEYEILCDGSLVYSGIYHSQDEISVPRPEDLFMDFMEDMFRVGVGVARYAVPGPSAEPLPPSPQAANEASEDPKPVDQAEDQASL